MDAPHGAMQMLQSQRGRGLGARGGQREMDALAGRLELLWMGRSRVRVRAVRGWERWEMLSTGVEAGRGGAGGVGACG